MAQEIAADSKLVGKIIAGKYRLLRCIGEGGMGTVYEAEHMGIGTRVAVKVLRPEHSLRTDAVRRFEQEARTTAKIGHPNIVAVRDLDRDPADGSLYMVQELLSGTALGAFVARAGCVPVATAIQIVRPVLSALAAAHDRGVLHRDVKPANIFLATGADGAMTPKVIDFGIAKVMSGGDETDHTREGMILGTLSYMSPEQLVGDPNIDARADIWAMGVVLYELLTGGRPFPSPSAGAGGNALAIARFAQRVSEEPPPRIETRLPGIAPDLAAIVHRALAIRPDARFQTMHEFDAALASCSAVAKDASDAPVRVASEGVTVMLPPQQFSLITEVTSRMPVGVLPMPGRARRRGLLFLLGAMFLVALLGGVWIVFGGWHGAGQRPPKRLVERAPIMTVPPPPPPETPLITVLPLPPEPAPTRAVKKSPKLLKRSVGSNGMPVIQD